MNSGTREEFRDTLGIVSAEGKRKWIYPKQPNGFFYRTRTLFSIGLLAVLFGTPFIAVNGHPFMLFDVVHRRFILFGTAFGPHDFYLFVLAMLALIVFIILFTVIFGRLFCGWVCPQTVFMEMVFRRIDYWIEGDFRAQKRLAAAPWNAGKVVRKAARHALYFGLSFLIGNTFLAWIIGVEELRRIVTDPPSLHIAGLTAMLLFTGMFYWVFVWFREQACVLVCPYGRLQGVLLDRNSIVIAYDHVRGEPRGRLRRGAERTEGDCIDCGLCVDVCPTGIDIRNGTQLECVNCTACIDACDDVMDRVAKPRGLIRYDSAEGIRSRTGFRWTTRATAYTAVLIALLTTLTILLLNRKEIDVTVLRTPGMFFQEQPDGRVSNIYDITILNKTFSDAHVVLRLSGLGGEVRPLGDALVAPPQKTVEGKIMVVLPRSSLAGMSTPLLLEVQVQNRPPQLIHSTFLGPGRGR